MYDRNAVVTGKFHGILVSLCTIEM